MLRCLLCRASLQCPGSYSDVLVWNWWTYELPDSALVSVSWKSYPLAKYSLSGVCLATCSVSQSQSVLKSDMKFSSSSLCIYQQLVKCSLKLFCWGLLVNFSTCPVLCLKSHMVALLEVVLHISLQALIHGDWQPCCSSLAVVSRKAILLQFSICDANSLALRQIDIEVLESETCTYLFISQTHLLWLLVVHILFMWQHQYQSLSTLSLLVLPACWITAPNCT